MKGVRVLMRSWIAILSIAILAMPMTGAHLHLCFDGDEPPVSLHATYDGMDQSTSVAPLHHDLDVQLSNTALGKKVATADTAPALLAAANTLPCGYSIALLVIPRHRADTFVSAADNRLLPPPRAPPV